MRAFLIAAVVLLASRASSAAPNPKKLVKTVTVDWTGANPLSTQTFTPIFADYNAAAAEEGLIARVESFAPTDESTSSTAYHFEVSNRADDIYFGVKGLVTGLPKNTKLKLSFDVTIASSVGPDCFGIGGSPGTSVWVKAGAAPCEPLTKYDAASQTYRFANVNKGEQAMSGPAGSVLGNVAVEGGVCDSEEDAPFKVKTFTNAVLKKDSGADYVVRSSPKGELWLLVGFESGFEGISSLFLQKVTARIYRAE